MGAGRLAGGAAEAGGRDARACPPAEALPRVPGDRGGYIYDVSYTTRRGRSISRRFRSYAQACELLRRLAQARLEATLVDCRAPHDKLGAAAQLCNEAGRPVWNWYAWRIDGVPA